MKRVSCIIPFLIVCSNLSAMPEGGEVAAGQAEFRCVDGNALEIVTSDKAIINYKKFNVGDKERVQFIQPSGKSVVLNRVKGSDQSKILGNLSANGRVFLVNPNGIYFGPNSTVNAGSFLASTLNIRDEDFLNDKFQFFLEPGSEGAKIINEGIISAGAEGFIAFLAPIIENRGSILARAGKVLLGSGERVTLDFTGDGLIQFTIDGDLKQALIENYGQIEAASGAVQLSMRTARDAIRLVVNTDGITPANAIEESNGVVRLVSKSHIAANQVQIDGGDGSQVHVEGTIDASNIAVGEKGGAVHVLGKHVELAGAGIDVSGDLGGGTVLIGGDYQGKGDVRTARITTMDNASQIYADAYRDGDGGKVILWADDTTLFDGKIYARGGVEGGDGGFVETSGEMELGIQEGFVDTSAPQGKFGDWLLDPATINIQTGGGSTIALCSAPNCASNGTQSIDPATIAVSATNVSLCAQRNPGSSINVTNAVAMANSGVSLTLTAGSTNVGTINLNNNITTKGGAINLTGVVVVGSNVVLDTTNAGGTPAGSNISFSNTINGSGSRTLSLNGGTSGAISMPSAVGATTALASLTATGATVTQGSTAKTTGALSYTGSTAINLGGNITTSGNTISLLTGPVTLNANVALDTTNAGGSPAGAGITVNGNVSQATTNSLTVNGGTGGAVSIGGNLNVNAFTVTHSGGTTITGTTTAPTVTLTNTTGSITFNGSTTVTTAFNTAAQGYGLVFNNGGTITPATTFLNTGGVTLKSGSSTSLTFANGLTSTASATTILGAVKATTAASAMSFGNVTFSAGNSNVSTAGGTIGFGGTVTLTGNAAVDSTNGGGTPAGAGITFTGPVNGPGNLTVAAGTGGAVSFVGAVGGAPQVGVLTISSAGNVTANAITASSIVQSAGSGTTTFNGLVNTNGAAGISLTGTNFAVNANVTTTNTGPFTVNHSGTYTIASGVVFNIDGIYTDNGTGGGTTNLVGTINTNGTNITFANPVVLTGTAALNTGSGVGNILFQSTLDGTQNLTLATGNGNITFTGAVGTTRLGTLTINATNNVTANALSATVFNQTAGSGVSTFNGPVNISGGAGFSFVGANATMNSSLTTASGGLASFQVGNTLTLGSSAALNLDGAFSQTGIGSAHISGSITTTNDNIQFLGPVALTGPTVLNTGAGIGNILFSSTVDGPGALTMTAGTGNITLSSAAGSATRLGAVTINSSTAVSTQAISAASINQAVAATGTSTYSGNLNTNAAAGIQLNSGALTVSGNLITTNGGPVGLAHNGTLSLTAGLGTLIDSTFTESGSGGVNLSGRILTNNAAVSFANAVALTGTTLISSGSLAGSVNFSSTIDGGQDLTVSSGTGNTVFGGNVGIGTRLNNLTIALANNVTASSISAATFSQLGGTGTSTFNGPINTNAVGGVSLVGSGFTVNSTITTTAAGPVSITNSGTLNLASGAICSIGGAFAQINTGGVTLSGQVTAGGNISFQGPVTLSGSPTLSTAAASKNITLSNTVNGGGNLTLAAGGGNIALQNPIGASTRIGALNIASALDVSTLGITAASVTQQAGTGTTTIVGDLNTNALSGISFTLNNLIQTGGLATSNAGPVTVTNSGTFTSVLTGSGVIDGFYLQNGTGAVNLSGTVRTNNQPISFASPVTLNSDVALNSGSGAGNITLSGTVNGAHQLNLTAGTGNVLLSGIIGGTTPLSSLQFTSAQNITAQNAVTANAIVQTAGSGTTIFNGPLSATTGSGIALTGSAFQFNNTVTTTNAGPFTLSNSGTALFAGNFTIDGAFAQSGAGGVSLNASLATNGTNLSIGSPIALMGNSSLNAGGAGIGAITLSSTVDGAHTLSLSSGPGDTTVSGAIGAATALTSFSASGNNVTVASIGTAGTPGVSGATNLTATNNLNFTGANYNAAAQNYSALTANINTVPLATFATSGSSIDFSLAPIFIGTNANLAINSSNGAITMNTIDAATNSARSVTLNAGNGVLTLANVGTLGNAEIANLSLTAGDILIRGNLFTNAISFSTASPHVISIGGDITTVGTPILFPSNVDIIRDTVNNATLTSNGGDITFQGKINGDIASLRRLTIAAGSGNAFFNGEIGGVAALDQLNITSANNVTTAAATVGSITQTAGTGNTTFGGQITTKTGSGLNLTGAGFTFLDGVDTTTNNGNINIANSGTLTLNSGVIWNLGGGFSQTGSGPVSLGVHIDSNNSIDIASPVTLIGTTLLDTSAVANEIHLHSTVDGGFDLTFEAGTSNVIVDGAIGSGTRIGALSVVSASNITFHPVSASSMNLNWGTGTFSFTGALNTNGPAGIVLTGTNIFTTLGTVTTTNGGPLNVSTTGTTSGSSGGPTVVSGSITQSSTGIGFIGGTFKSLTGNITTVHNIRLNAPLIVDTSAGGGNIIVQGTVDGGFPVTFLAGTGNIDLQQPVGSSTRIGAMTINSANDVTTQSINAASITQLAGTGTTTFNGALNTNTSSGISISTNSVVRGAAITTTNSGPCAISISNTGTLTSTAAGLITVSGPFTQSGTGSVAFGGTINTTSANISFAGPITLSSDAVFNTGILAGNTTLSSTVQGAHALRISAGTGNIVLGGAVGTALTPLTSVIIDNATNVTAQSITAGFIQQGSGTGTSTFNGALTANTATGISLIGSAFAFNAPFTTTALGPFTLTNSGLATMSAAATGSVNGAFLQNGAGTTQLSNAIASTASSIQFAGPVTLSTAASLMTTNQPITLLSTLDSTASTPGSLTVSSGTGDFTIGANAGLVHPLNALTISTARNVTTQAITAASITQSAGTGTTLFNNNIITTEAGGVNLNGTAFSILGNVTTGNGGPILIVNAGTLTTTNGKTLFGDGGFSQSGGGSVSLASNVSANNNDILFTNPITLTANIVLNSGTSAGDITVGTVDGGFDLTFTAGRDIFAGAIGGTTRVGTVTATTVRDNHASSITAGAIVQLAGTGTTSLAGNIDTNTAAGINLVGNNFTRSGSIITTNGGSFTVTNSGLITGTSINTTSIDGSYTQIGVGSSAAHNLAGTLTARQGISLSSPITLLSDPLNLIPIILDTSGGNGNILVSGTIDNDANAAHKLILRSGSGNTTLSAAVGGTAPIGPFVLGNVNNVTAAAITADSVQQEAATTIAGNAAFNGAIATSGSSGIVLSGFGIAFNNNVSTASNGPMTITPSNQLTLANGITAALDGPFTQSGAGPVSLGATITTTNDNISFSSPVTLTGNANLNTNSGIGDITFSSSVNGPFALVLTAGTGNLSLQGIGNTTSLAGLTVNSAASILANTNIAVAGPISLTTAGALTFNGTVTTTAGGAIALTNGGTLSITNPIVSSSSFIQSQTGTPTINLKANLTTAGTLQLASSATLTNNIVLNSGGGSLNLLGTVDSDATPRNLTLTAGSGSIALSSALGGTNPLSAFQISSAANVTASNISAASITQSAGTGLSHFTGTLSTTALSGVSLTGTQFTLDGIVTTTNGGPLAIVHSGALTLNPLPASGSHSLTGAFSESGGSVSTGANITTANKLITFADPVTLIGDTTLTSNNGNITFSNTIDGPFCLTLAAGTGIIELDGAVGSNVNLGCLTATGSVILQNSSITSTGPVQETGQMQINGNITTSANDITLTGNVTLTAANGTISTGSGSGGGTVHITGTVNPNLSTNNFTFQTGSTGTVTFDNALGGLVPFHNITVTAGTLNLNNFGSTSSGANGTAAFTAATDLNFTGTSYTNATQIYTAGSNFNFNAGALTTITSNGNPISFVTGTIQLSNLNDLTINGNGGNVTLTDLFGAGRTLNITDGLGTVTVAHIGTSVQPLNAINVTSATLIAPFTTFPPINFTFTAPTLIGVNQVDPTTYNSPVQITADNILFSFSTCPGGNNIIFNSTLDSDGIGNSRNIVFDMCGNTLTFNGTVGSTAPLTSIRVNDDSGVNVNAAMTVGAYTQSTSRVGATSSFNNGLTTVTNAGPLPTSGNVDITSPNITLSGSLSIAGTTTLDNSGTLLATGISCVSQGAFQQTGTGGVTISGSVDTSDTPISFHGPLTLNGDLALNTVNSTGGNITLDNTVSGNFDLTTTVGSGQITFSNDLGTALNRLDDVVFVSNQGVQTKSIFAATITQQTGSGTFAVVGDLNTNGSAGINLAVADLTHNGNVVTANGGNFVANNSGTITLSPGYTATVDGSYLQNGSGAVSFVGTVAAKTGISFAGALSLTGTSSLDTSSGGGAITFNNTVNGAQNLTLKAGSGNVFLNSPVGGGTPIGFLILDNLNNFTSTAISADSISQALASTITGLVTFNGAISTTGGSGIVLAAPQFDLSNNITTTGGGPLTLTNSGSLTFANGTVFSLSGPFTQSGGGPVFLTGAMTTSNQDITFTNAVNLTGSTTLSSGAGAGNILFSSTLDGAQTLDLTAGTGAITFTGSVGATNSIGDLTVHSSNGVTYPLVNAASITQAASSGTTTINGPLTTTSLSGISLTGESFTQNGSITTLNQGTFAIRHSGTFTMAAGSGASIGGSYTDNPLSTGAIFLRGTITAGGSIAFSSPGAITLAAAATLSSGTSNGGITINGTIDGANDLTLDSNADLILISADIGTGTRIGALIIDDISNADFQKITAASLSQAVGTGTTTFHDTIDVNGASGIFLSGTSFTFDNTVNASAGPVSIANSGTLAFNSGANVTSASDFLQNGTGPLHLANAITTTNGTINCQSDITLTGTASLDSSAGNKQILLHGLVDGANDLSLASGSGSITAIQAIGSGTRIGDLSISSSGALSFNAINAGSITQTGTATAVYNADLNTNAAGGISLTGAAITFGGNATTSAAGPITIANSGLFTAPIGKTLSADGGFSQSGGNVFLGSNVLANSAPISFGSPITLTSDVLLNSMSSGSGGANITVDTVDGAFSLTFTLGSGDITAGNIGDTTPLTAVIATSVHDNNAQNITAGTVQQYAGSGTTTLNGDMTSTSSLGITLVGTNFTRVGKIITQNGGSFTVTNSGLITGSVINTTDIDGFYIQNGAGTTNFAGTIKAREGISFLGPLVLLFNGTLDTSSGNGNITLSNTIDNFDLITPHALTLNAGVGNITLSSALGASKPLSSLKLTGNSVSMANIGTPGTPGLTGTLQIPDPASLITPNQIVFNGTAVNAAAQTYAATTSFNMNAGALTTILSNGQPINFTTGTVQLAANTDLTVNSVSGTTGGNITTADIHAGANSQRSLTLNAGTAIASPGTILPGIIGSTGNGEFASVSLTGVLTLPNSIAANAITFVPTGAMTVGGNLTTVNSGLTFPTAVTLTGSKTFTTGGGSIIFSNTLDGDVGNTRSLSLAAGTGDITFADAVGGTFPLNVLGIASARNVTATAAGASITAASIIQSSGSGTTEFGRNLSTTASPGVTFNGKNLQFDSTSVLNTTNSGSLFVANTGTFTFAGTATLSGGVSQVGTGAVALSGSIAADQPVSFAAPVGLTGTPSIDTSSTGQSITFSNTVNGPGGLSLKAGNGNIAMNNTIGGTTALGAMTIVSANNINLQPLSAASLTFTNFSGLATYQTITTMGAAGVQLTGNNFIRNGALNIGGGGSLTITNSGFIRGFATNTAMIDGSYTQNGAGPNDLSGSITVGNNISFASAITLMDPSSLTTTGNGTITLSSAVDGNQNFTLAAGSGTINLNGNVGVTNRIGALTISSAGTVSAQAINAASIVQSSGSGTTTFNGTLNTNSIAGISLTGTNFVRGANWTTSNSGPITLSLASGGSFTSTAAGTINSAGAFSQLGLGSVSLAQTINTTNAAILFSGPISLAGTTTLNTGSAGGITFNNTLDGAAALILTGGAGDIIANSAVGGGTRLGDITINSANNVDFQALKAASLTQLSGGGTTTLNGPTDLNTALGIDFNGTNCTINGSLTTSNTGGVSIENDGLLTVTGTCSIDGDFVQDGMGPSLLSGAIASIGGQIAFSSPVTAFGSPQLTTSSQSITFSSTLDGASSGAGNLTLDAGAGGDITFTGEIGSINRLGSLSLSNVRNAAMNAITAGSITQASGAGTTSILGTINTSNVLGINLIGNAFTVNGSIITTNGGPMSLNHANPVTLIFGPSTLISGPFTESGAGTVSMSGLLHTDSADITFNNPITLLNPTTINSDGSGDILISSTIDGATDLTLDSGTNSITVLGAIGGTTPLNNLIIAAASDASFQAINAQTITQLAGTGTTTFNAAVTTSLASGIGLTGNAFTFNAPVTTNGGGKVQINNAGLLTIAATGTMNLTGPFTQVGTGSTLLSGNISIDNDAISFAGPVALGNTVSLNTATATGSITFFNALDGAQNLNLTAGIGAINFNGAVGGTTALGALNVVSVFDLNSQSITASSINLSTAYDLATFNGPLSTSGAPGIVLSGYSFTFNNNVTTVNTGPLTVTNTGPVTFSPTSLVTVDGPFAMNGTGLVNAGGTLTTNNQPATFSSAVLLNGNYSINTGTTGANVMFSSDLDGPFNLNIAAGLGDVLVQKAVGDGSALNNFTVAAHDVTLTGVGTTAAGVVGELSLMASDAINLGNQFYSAGTQTYTAATAINFVNSLSVTTLNSFGGPISFNGAPVVLSNGNDLSIFTNNGALSYTSISGTTFENISINMGNGTAFMNPITGSHINNLLVNAGQIELIGSINAVNTDFESLGAIFNSSAPQAVNSLNIATFNALNGDVGTIASPILVHSSNQVFAGAGGRADSLAVFNGSSVDNTIHAITSNPPCIIIFNGVEIKNCNAPPVPPTPSGQRAHAKAILPFPFAVPGFDSSYFNLASDYFFFPYFFDDSYVRKDALMYYRAPAQTSNRAESFGRYKPYYFNLFKPFKGLNLELETGKPAADLFAFLQIENRAPFEGKPKVKKSS